MAKICMLFTIIEILSCNLHVTQTKEDHSSLMIGYYVNTCKKKPIGSASKNKKIPNKVDSEGKYGR